MTRYTPSAPETIQEMFASVAPNYDRANTAFSFGLHKWWNRSLLKTIGPVQNLLDLCAGTGEIALGHLKKNPNAKALLLDFCPEMLAVAKEKGAPYQERFSCIVADAQELPLDPETFDGATVSYGIRNVQDPLKCFHEVYRVLKPGGRFAILELTRPRSPLMRTFHRLYLKALLPLLGALTAKNIEAYKYLASSIQDFSSPDTLTSQLNDVGFTLLSRRSLLGGVATLLLSQKPR
ncbi:MAG: Demethylmenaquinone methyltransferase [Chlamydiae bacterium]|nr:Demethylmenaquinone methyltransferase [Chlamydiota bacterium]